MSSRSSITYQYLSYGYDGTGHVVYDGYLYYNEAYGPGIRVDLATMARWTRSPSRVRGTATRIPINGIPTSVLPSMRMGCG